MEYLFFDIECANCDNGFGKICSFGYVITDTYFNILESEDIIIDPRAPFRLTSYGRNQKKYIELAYSEDTFRAAPPFSEFYKRLSYLLTRPDTLLFGYAPENDAGFLASEFERYQLPNVDFEFCDVQRIFKRHIKDEGSNQFSLVRACETLGVDTPETVHKSVDDAMATMCILKRICEESGEDASALMSIYAPCKGELKDGELNVSYFKKKPPLEPWELNLMKGINEDNFKKLIKRNPRSKNGNVPALRGKTVCFSGAYEFNRYKQMCLLVPLIAEGGARLTRKVKECNMFVTGSVRKADGKPARCQRTRQANQAVAEGKNIRFVNLKTFLEWLGLDEARLDEMAFPSNTVEESCE